ncbi:tripartite tricarboxylate transporter TctB family protein [Pseudoponticoccus marisrubri]|uniref:DUF1468 domain-containing protein n=1 Tax=Pseudoponticoccus marisrubri TaxID=1685382 RepID=A0A0W7WH59_9RHOB|nr:tripartite tricarboxylate transporter TctB family protein [Pseudoponticoccus marisrubri]KUF09937.1 hypothetical protein AVJ23_14410 [Pseudoponticoccus marisrubri]
MPSPAPLRPGERLFALLLVLFAGFAFHQSHAISGFEGLTTGGVMPMLASGVMVVTALVILSDTLRRPQAETRGLRGLVAYLFPLRVVLFAALVAAYGAAIPLLGFLVASGGLLFVAIWMLWTRGPLVALVLALASVGAIHVLFRMVFKVVLPGGSLWS